MNKWTGSIDLYQADRGINMPQGQELWMNDISQDKFKM